MKKQTVLITGASSGIGYELSKIFARNGYDLILVSRKKSELANLARELEEKHNIQSRAIAKDLSKSTAPQELYDEIASHGIAVSVLVNNAGFGLKGNFVDLGIEEQVDLIQLNITALTILCKFFGKDMAKRGGGKILNVASTAAFQAGPFMSTYYASKAYVLSLSEGIGNELKKSGVRVSVLCPGPTRTAFWERSKNRQSNLLKVPWVMKAEDVAQVAYSGLMKRKKIIIPGKMNNILVFSIRFIPRSIAALICRYLNK
jgi:short-subunit dehydrogenase